MSRNITDHRQTPKTQIVGRLNATQRQQARQRTLQLQGNESLSLGVLSGYFTISIQETIEPATATLDVTAPTGTTIMLGNLMYSTFFGVAAGAATPTGVTFQNGDAVGIFPDNLRWECFLAYDSGETGDPVAIVDDNVARITAKVQAYEAWSIPIGLGTSLAIFYQVRATLI